MSKAPEVIWANPNGDVISIRNGYPDLNTLIATGRLTKYVRADRIEELEDKLAKALDFIQDLTGCEWPYDEDAKRILAELTGGKDE